MITRILFESIWMLAAVLVAAQFLLIAIWSWLRSRWAARLVWIGFAAIPLLLILSSIIVTPREQIVAVCRELAEAVELEDLAAIERHMAHEIEVDGLDRSAFTEHVQQVLRRFNIHDPELRKFEVKLQREGRGVVTFNAFCRIESEEMSHGWLPSRWRLKLRRADDAWLVVSIESIPIPPLQLRALDRIPR